MIPLQFALRRRMMTGGGGATISDLPLGALINVVADDGVDAPNYEIADKDNLVSGGVVLVRKNIHSTSRFIVAAEVNYPNGTLDNLIKNTIYNKIPQKIRDKMMEVSFNLSGSGDITRKMFALTYTMAGFGDNNGVAEGKALQLYTSDASRVKAFKFSVDDPAEADSWWLSSQFDEEFACGVTDRGSVYGSMILSENGVVPAFVLPSKTPYDPIQNPDGSYNLFQNKTISDLPLGALINVVADDGVDAPNYEIADKDNLVSGGVVLVRKNIHSTSRFGSNTNYPNSTLDNLIESTIYIKMPQLLQNKMMEVSFNLSGSGDITRKMFALTYTMAGFGDNNGVAEGKALQLYTSNASRIKTLNGSADFWWLSSQISSNYAWRVESNGATNSTGFPTYSKGVVPAFVIPSKTPYDPTPNPDGSYNLFL